MGEIAQSIHKWRRPAWKPITTPYHENNTENNTEDTNNMCHSKFSGGALLLPEEKWPACLLCKAPMPLFVQIVGSELPSNSPDHVRKMLRDSVLQLFYCTEECEHDGGWDTEDTKSKCARIIPYTGAIPTPSPANTGGSVLSVITGWEECEDYPSFSEDIEGYMDIPDPSIRRGF